MRGVSTSDLMVNPKISEKGRHSEDQGFGRNERDRHSREEKRGSNATTNSSPSASAYASANTSLVNTAASSRTDQGRVSEHSSVSSHSSRLPPLVPHAKHMYLPSVSTHPPDPAFLQPSSNGLNIAFAASAVQNSDFRTRMNDCHDIHVSDSRAFFGVYDGHHGDATALWCKAKLRPLVYAAVGAVHERPASNKPRPSMFARTQSVSQSVATDTDNASGGGSTSLTPSSPRFYTPDLSLRISAAFWKLNEWIVARSGYSVGGACATIAFVEHTRRKSLAQSSNSLDPTLITRLVVANVGDCVAVMSHKGRAQRMTADHTLSSASERERVVAGGGLITHKKVDGLHRVTRSIGDKSFKRYISARPFVSDTVLGAADELLILASNGLWDVVDDQTCVDLVRHIDDCKVASDTLASYALKHGAADNLTVVVIRFQPASMCREYPSQEATGEAASIASTEGESRRLLSTRRAFSQSGYIPGPGLATLSESGRVLDRVARFSMFATLTRTHDAIFDNPDNYTVIMAAAEMSLRLKGKPLFPERMNSVVSVGTMSSCSPRSSLTCTDDDSQGASSPTPSLLGPNRERPSVSSMSSTSGSSFNRRSQYMRSRSQVSGICTYEELEELEELDRLRTVNYSGLLTLQDLLAADDDGEQENEEVVEEEDEMDEMEMEPRERRRVLFAPTRSQRSSTSTLAVSRTSTASSASTATIDDECSVAERFSSMFNQSRPSRKMSRALENISFEPRQRNSEGGLFIEDDEYHSNNGSGSGSASGSASNTPSGTPSASQSFINLQRDLRDRAHVAGHHISDEAGSIVTEARKRTARAASSATGMRHPHIAGFFPSNHEHVTHKKSNSVTGSSIPTPEESGATSSTRDVSKERSFSVQLGNAPHHLSHLLHSSNSSSSRIMHAPK